MASSTFLPSPVTWNPVVGPPETPRWVRAVAVPEETSKVATSVVLGLISSAASTPPPVASCGAAGQLASTDWGVATGSAAAGSTDPTAPLPFTVPPYQTFPPATATETGPLPVPVA